MRQKIINIDNGVCRMPKWRMAEPVTFTLYDDEHLAVVGPNGGGKSMFIDMLVGRHPALPDAITYDFSPRTRELVSDNIKYITFRDTYGGDNDRTYFLQQRWNQMEIDAETPTAGRVLEEAFLLTGEDTPERRKMQQQLYELFHISYLLDKYIILLSSGELRKIKLASSLFSQPRVLILDNPFIGLDADTRQQLKELLTTITQQAENTTRLMLVLSKIDEIPEFITHVVEIRDMKIIGKSPRSLYINKVKTPDHVLSEDKQQAIIHLPASDKDFQSDIVLQLNDVSIRYGERTILKELSWTVRNGERWALSGQNGAGKSTLLSLICADNPQAYACDITLFGKERGSGESIWDIKKHIGYVSPEMHRAYLRPLPAIRVVASGLLDSVGLYVKPTENDYVKCRFWMDIFGIGDKANTLLTEMSSGEQRLVLLARAFVKDPELLILDEPLHGLDNTNRRLVKDVIETFCQRKNKTLIMVTHYQEEWPACIDNSIILLRN